MTGGGEKASNDDAMRKVLIFALLVALAGGGCGKIENSARLAQPVDQQLVAGVGDTIAEFDLRESLPNIAGKADLFGRTRPRGKILVTYLGMSQGRAVFERHTIHIQSTATTMNSTPLVIPQTSTTTYSGNTTFSGGVTGHATTFGTATTTAPPIILPPSGSSVRTIANNRIRYYLDLSQDRSLFVEGHEILIMEARAAMVRYQIRKLGK